MDDICMAAVAGTGFDKHRCLPGLLPLIHTRSCAPISHCRTVSSLLPTPLCFTDACRNRCPCFWLGQHVLAQAKPWHRMLCNMEQMNDLWALPGTALAGCSPALLLPASPYPLHRDSASPCPCSCLHTGGSRLCRAGAAEAQHCLWHTLTGLS